MEDKQLYAKQLLQAVGGDIRAALTELKRVAANTVSQKKYEPKSQEVVIRTMGLQKQYKMGKATVSAIQDVTLAIHKGEFIAITGTSGSGKSTLLHLIGGLDQPSAGDIEVRGQNLRKLSDVKLSRFRNRTIGFVFQFFYLQPFLRLQTNVEVPAMFARTRRDRRATKSKATAEIVGLSDRLQHFPRELSGGQMQRAAIARALQNEPDILLADEPTGNLDHENAVAIFELFKKISTEQGTTIVVVTHDMALAAIADRAVQMKDGRILA